VVQKYHKYGVVVEGVRASFINISIGYV